VRVCVCVCVYLLTLLARGFEVGLAIHMISIHVILIISYSSCTGLIPFPFYTYPMSRFEIDMVIDTNMAALKLLEPIAEEIHNLRLLPVASDLVLPSLICLSLSHEEMKYVFTSSI